MSTVLTILLTVFMFGLLIFIHEAGHYFVARAFGVGISEFAIGMGPKLVSWKGKKNLFSLRAFPIGGYVSMVGEFNDDETLSSADIGKAPFNGKPIWQRLLVIIAGPAMNIILGILIMAIIVISAPNLYSTTIDHFGDKEKYIQTSAENLVYVTEDIGSGENALQKGDVIMYVDATHITAENGIEALLALYPGEHELRVMRKNTSVLLKEVALPEASKLNVSGALAVGDKIINVGGSKVRVVTDMTYAISREGIEPVNITVIRDGKELTVENVVFPMTAEDGILLGGKNFATTEISKSFGNVAYNAFFQSTATLKIVIESVIDTLTGRYGIEAVSGPIGVGSAVGETAQSEEPVRNLSMLLMLISLSLGIGNLLPLPVLDGGRFVLLVIEAIRRKPLNQKVEQTAIAVSMVLMLLLMVVIAFKDVFAIIK